MTPNTVSVIMVSPEGWLQGMADLPAEDRTSAYAYHKPWWRGGRFYHRDGTVFEVSSAVPLRPLGPFSSFLANTVYNPRIVVRYEYRTIGSYDMSTLREAIGKALDTDDDLLTQFDDAATQKGRLAQAETFDAIAKILRLTAT